MAAEGPNSNQDSVALTSGGTTTRLLKNGDLIGDSYRLKGLIGRGGMGYVFRAEHIIIKKDYALKMLAPDQINEVTWNRFQSEGKAIARLDHTNIVKIYNMGVDQGDYPYYVMDLLDGVALSDCIADKMEFTLDEILDMFIQLASGLGYAHGHGIIHRDVKPSNVMLIASGGLYPLVKIVDFGIAKLAGTADLKGQSLTATGEIFGSPFYMSPEQCLGTNVDQRSDIYSLGCTLFEALSGRPPFVGESAVQTVMMHQNQPSPTLKSVSSKFCSAEMEELVVKMLMKRPADRYQSMEQLGHDLERVKAHKGVGKSVETGFKTSLPSQLEELGAGYEQEKLDRQKGKKTLIVCGTVVAVLSAVVCVSALLLAARPAANAGRTAPHSVWQTKKDIEAGAKLPDKKLDAAEEKLALVGSIPLTIDKASVMKVFHCPDVAVGTFLWFTDPDDWLGINFGSIKDGRAAAIGEARVPAVPLRLIVNRRENREVWTKPDVLGRFGPSDLVGLRLESEHISEAFSGQNDAQVEALQVVALLKAVSGWSNLQSMYFHGCPAPDQALIELDKHKTLRQLILRDSAFNAGFLARRDFMKRLTSIQIIGADSTDGIFAGLKDSPALAELKVLNSKISAAGLKSLAGCHNLKIMMVEKCEMDSAAIEAMSEIKSLFYLSLAKVGLQPQQMPLLTKLVYVKHLALDISRWSKEQKLEIFGLMPNVNMNAPLRKQMGAR